MTTQIKGNATSTFGGNVDVTGNVVTDAPCFRAKQTSPASVTGLVWTKIQLNSVDFDTTSDFDNITNYRYTPSVAGYYHIDFQVEINNASIDRVVGSIYKNGSESYILSNYVNATNALLYPSAIGSGLIYMNGTTDYLELYVNSSNTANTGTARVFMNAHLARAV